MRNDLKAKQRQFVFDPLLRSGCSENESYSIVLYFWEFRKKILRTAFVVVVVVVVVVCLFVCLFVSV